MYRVIYPWRPGDFQRLFVLQFAPQDPRDFQRVNGHKTHGLEKELSMKDGCTILFPGGGSKKFVLGYDSLHKGLSVIPSLGTGSYQEISLGIRQCKWQKNPVYEERMNDDIKDYCNYQPGKETLSW